MNKTEFKKECYSNVYSGHHIRINAIFFDWKSFMPDKNDTTKFYIGYKFMVKSNTKNCSKQDLFDIMYNWVNKGIQPPYYVSYKYANTDMERFKVPLCG